MHDRSINITTGIQEQADQRKRQERITKTAVPSLEQGLGKTRSACVREAIANYLSRFDGDEEAKRQSSLIAATSSTQQWSEPLPDWDDWTA